VVGVVVDVLVDDLLLKLVELWVLALEPDLVHLFGSDIVEGHPYLLLALVLEIQEGVGLLQLLKVHVNVFVVVHVFLDLSPPLADLLVVHELLTIKIVKQQTDLCVRFVLELKP